jgi:hypothetical protein
MKDPELIKSLIADIDRLHSCKASHVGTVPTKESFQGKTVWEGEVELFELTGHPKASRCYAWKWTEDGKAFQTVTVLELPPVDSAQTAVQAYIVGSQKKAK